MESCDTGFSTLGCDELVEIDGGLKISIFCKGATYVCSLVAIGCGASGVAAPIGALWEIDALGFTFASELAARHNM